MAGKKGKGKKRLIKLVNKETGFIYWTYKNPKLEKKLELMKYDPKKRQHTKFVEQKA